MPERWRTRQTNCSMSERKTMSKAKRNDEQKKAMCLMAVEESESLILRQLMMRTMGMEYIPSQKQAQTEQEAAMIADLVVS